MQDYLKNAGVFLGHIICVLILLYCFANPSEPVPDKQKEVHTVKVPFTSPTISATPSLTVTQFPQSTPVLTAEPTSKPLIEVSATPTLEPTLTVIPTIIPTIVATDNPISVPTQEPTMIPIAERDVTKQAVRENIKSGVYSELSNYSDSWWFRRKENHVPSGSGEEFDISEYQGVFLNKGVTEEDKVIYLTIDCGYGSDNTAVLLDIFKEHNVEVTFFVTSFFLEANPDEVCRMADEGHLVGNHSVTHPDLTELTDEEIYSEIIGCEEAYHKLTGKQMDLFFRPPGGDYSRRTMQITKDLGYMSVFWSIAYNDYEKNNQPGKEYVLEHFETYHHNGAIVLMHNDSDSNREAMEEVILYLKQQGYRFGSLEELRQGH